VRERGSNVLRKNIVFRKEVRSQRGYVQAFAVGLERSELLHLKIFGKVFLHLQGF
jgi:hypothetical protein